MLPRSLPPSWPVHIGLSLLTNHSAHRDNMSNAGSKIHSELLILMIQHSRWWSDAYLRPKIWNKNSKQHMFMQQQTGLGVAHSLNIILWWIPFVFVCKAASCCHLVSGHWHPVSTGGCCSGRDLDSQLCTLGKLRGLNQQLGWSSFCTILEHI